MELGITGIPVITAICYLVGMAAKASAVPNKWIPTLCGLAGGMLGVAALYVLPGFPAGDCITGAAVGIISGLAATGLNQSVRQLTDEKQDKP